ncbi:HNH endonuclease signature motif containing protein [Mycolicibacterium baixiangningiae]|uniref:HNH endonuclease signature motif containing protein n=1 Tax=Mycolicibacterium baixiangningiae TaxID=2761578 RepID=UPI00186871B7|nr:HNH endonuclease signature motif containing protein [Mycolicibacterium baixiangningiae]
MFDGSLPEIGAFSALSDAELVAASAGWGRVESAAAARKLAAMAEVFRRRTGIEDAEERENWFIDPETSVLSELAAAHHITDRLASAQTHRGVLLANRFPNVAALFEAGLISDLVIRTIVYRTYLITDPDAMAAVDAALAEQVLCWGPKSQAKTEEAIDALVEIHDPAALRRREPATHTRDLQFGTITDAAGMMTVYARVYSPDGVALEQHVEDLARTVCPDDPRTLKERRNDAFAALSTGQPLRCECDNPDCPATTPDRPTPTVVIHLITTEEALAAAKHHNAAQEDNGDQPAAVSGGTETEPAPVEPDNAAREQERTDHGPLESASETSPESDPVEPGNGVREDEPTGNEPQQDFSAECKPVDLEPAPTPKPSPTPAPAFVIGGGVLSPVILPAFLDRAKLRQLTHPGDAPPEPRYVPSTALQDFVRCRDLTCRFPGCDKPAYLTDIDHTVPYPAGPTCASNLKCLCRKHHLLKTFWAGIGGWHDEQLPDGTVIWTSPNGQTHITQPGSALLFPTLCAPTAPIPKITKAPTPNSGVKMPKRRRSRAKDRAYRIELERRLNDAFVAERTKPPPF